MIDTLNLITIFVLCSINNIFAPLPWQGLEKDYTEVFDETIYKADSLSFFVDCALYSFADATPESIRDSMKNCDLNKLEELYFDLGQEISFTLCVLAQSGNSEVLEGLIKHHIFSKAVLHNALIFAQGLYEVDCYASLRKVGKHRECINLLSERLRNLK